jgi:hypothetical protein
MSFLPAELRIKVYKHILSDAGDPTVLPRKAYRGIILSCQQIHDEFVYELTKKSPCDSYLSYLRGFVLIL